MKIEEKYIVRHKISKEKKINPGLDVSIYQVDELGKENQIGRYKRDNNIFYNTFHPFTIDNKDYAFISKYASKTSIIELPSCKIIAEEDWAFKSSDIFYPVDFYVPPGKSFGFVAGCQANDSDAFKIQFIDLSDLKKGKFKREAKFGYIELPENVPLKSAISDLPYDDEDFAIDMAIQLRYNTNTGALITKQALAEILKQNGYIVFEKKIVIKENP